MDRGALRTTAASLRGPISASAVFAALLLAAVGLRTVTLLAYQPALFGPDSAGYIVPAERWVLPSGHPLGYPLFLRTLFAVWDDYTIVPAAQHLLGLGIAAILYLTLLRLGVRGWLAALAAAPVLLDAYQLNIEQYVFSDTLFEFLIVAGCAALLWNRPVTPPIAALAGGLFAAAALTRPVGLALLVAILVAIFVLRLRRAQAATLLGAFLIPVVVYAAAFKVASGDFGLTNTTGRYLYGRVITWVDCSKFAVPPHERPLCPGEHEQLEWVNDYLWTKRSPLYSVELPPGQAPDDVAGDFARRAILGQPLTYVREVAADVLLTFSPTRHEQRGEFRTSQWQFQTELPIRGHRHRWTVDPPKAADHSSVKGRVDKGSAEFLRSYQRIVFAPGPVLAACALIALAAVAGLGRARDSGLRGATLIFLTVGAILTVASVAATMFAWRYQLPQLVLFPPAAALGITALTGSRRTTAALRSAPPAAGEVRPA